MQGFDQQNGFPSNNTWSNTQYSGFYGSSMPQQAPKKSKKFPVVLVIVLAVVLVAAVLLFLKWDYLNAKFFCKVSVAAEEIHLGVEETHTIVYTVDPQKKQQDVVWISDDDYIARVVDGVVAGNHEGYTTLTALIDGVEKTSCTVYVTLKPVNIKNGQMVVAPSQTGLPEVTVNAPEDANCFAYFKDLKNGENDFGFYVAKGSSAKVNAPAGTYAFYYATGDAWYGKEYKFGENTQFFKSPDEMVLNETETSYSILELTLYAVPDGNMETRAIDESEFPI